MFKRNLTATVRDDDGTLTDHTVTPTKLFFSKNGDLRTLRVVDERNGQTIDMPVELIEAIIDQHGGEHLALSYIAGFDLPAEEVDDGTPVDRTRRRALLRTRGKETWRTLGRHLAHVPSDAFRIVYSHGLNQRRVKDVVFIAYTPRSDSVGVRDITNRRKQTIPVAMLLTVMDPRSGGSLEEEHEIRTFVQAFARRPLLAMFRGQRRLPEIA
jgi:hypothetical protein